MKRWALLTAGLYVLTLIVLAGPFVLASFFGDVQLDRWTSFYFKGLPYALPFFVAMGLIQLALLVVPVRVASKRPIARRHVFFTLLACIIALALLILASVATVYELMAETRGLSREHQWLLPFMLLGGIWLVWTFLFAFYTGRKPAESMMPRLCNWLIAGSILELLISVPAHIIARSRGYCCAGFLTAMGLATGIGVMLLAFGPAVFALFARRYASIKP